MKLGNSYPILLRYLDNIYLRTGSNSLGALLGGLALLPDGSSMDPAYTEDWNCAAEKAISALPAGTPEDIIAYHAALNFLDEWLSIGFDADISAVRDELAGSTGQEAWQDTSVSADTDT